MSNKFLIITSNLGGKDIIIDPDVTFPDCDYMAFVDIATGLKVWNEYAAYQFSNIDSYKDRRNAKLYKVLATLMFPQYEYIIWHDASFNLRVNPKEILDEYGDFELLLFNHPHRNCCYDEMDIVTVRNLESETVTKKQKEFYLQEGLPKNYGLFEMTCFIRKNTMTVTNLELMWWEQICKYSSRDQCSLTYCLWKSQQKPSIKLFNGRAMMYAGGNKYFIERPHLK